MKVILADSVSERYFRKICFGKICAVIKSRTITMIDMAENFAGYYFFGEGRVMEMSHLYIHRSPSLCIFDNIVRLFEWRIPALHFHCYH